MVKVAVNIVTFNSGDDIAACLESLQAQTFRTFAFMFSTTRRAMRRSGTFRVLIST
jgi:GT2 family glycosyltransferase